MTTLVNNFEGGTSGTTISTGNSGGASGNAFNAVTVGGGATVAYSSAHAAHGALSANVATVASASAYAAWSTSLGSSATLYYRMYMYWTGNPGANTLILAMYTSTPALCAYLQITTLGKLNWLTGASGQILTATTTIPLNKWFRIEGFVTGNAATGQVNLKLFTTEDNSVPAENDTSAATFNTVGTIAQVRFGVPANSANQGPFYMDDIGASTTGYLGPAVKAGGGGARIIPALTAADLI